MAKKKTQNGKFRVRWLNPPAEILTFWVFFLATELSGKFSESSVAKKKNPKVRRREKTNFRRSFQKVRRLKTKNPKTSWFFFIQSFGFFFRPPCINTKWLRGSNKGGIAARDAKKRDLRQTFNSIKLIFRLSN